MIIALLGGPRALAQQAASPEVGRPFADVPRDHWAYDAVEELRRLGILRGYPPQSARPAAEQGTWPRPAGESPGKQKAGRHGRPARKQTKPVRVR
jgi:hypothetical protein